MNCQLKTHNQKATWLILFWNSKTHLVDAEYWCMECVSTDVSESIISMTNLEFGSAIEAIKNV